ncbi:FAD-dependent pyridine nucleotide-disulphide oxidoreductase [Sulfurimonas denitrificans DSM 1251]|uniref:FAD-dependent pyridine nucleotide-disulphide oxidoreductase n=1 Tax=Sulfurimonas denitrificans (strain ATCC 33889 / DSM 1251) TaxID=326298 RepID=Q30R90_SULDN|nr:FAD-dependent oxidoreductase [Sulfurimonas denitrificans]ABB44491.1 FAD-dependent pyridine nucleotide-disulphide oxidoreductase [Sulfurimonas denitrificans DSM 1251]MDD3441673.1 FAD-dependent oxidoreductase [Sulfurimonas denitrificans]
MNKKVVVIGGGYGGLRAIEFLAQQSDMDVTLIDKHPYHYLQTEAYGYIAGRFDLHDVVIDLQDWCNGFKKKVTFIYDNVQSVDFEAQSVALCDGAISYDYLIIATGAKTNFFSFIEGLREHSFGVKSLHRAHNFRVEFENLLYKKLQNEETQEINLVIGGAGLSGVEVAAEMANVVEVYKKTIGSRINSVKIYLIDASETILPGMSDFLINSTHKRVEALGVNILTNAFIEKLDDNFIYFKNQEALKYHFMIFTGGIKASDLNECIDVKKNKISQFITDSMLNIAQKKNVFAIGDCVEIRDASGKILPPTAQSAERSAEYAAESIRKRIDNKTIAPFDAKVLGVFIALGGNWASGELFGVIKVKGYSAYLLKKAITYAYYLGLRLRINTGYKNRIKKP